MKQETLFSRIKKLGYKYCLSGARDTESCIAVFYRRVEAKYNCACNDKNQLVVRVYFFKYDHVDSKSITVDFIAERPSVSEDDNESGEWYKLECYSINWDEVDKIPDIERRLVKAWEALCE